ncbi:MAG TPA: nitrilase-related carbon-nitrogen hydrolase [Candidatus Binatia bacterium]|nr:nitrilase-related carbon-nitrogen hydrolase [Candidatus Binatia bacterium]
MARWVKIAAAQMGPINEGTSRDEVVDRMLALLDRAIAEQVELIAYPEMALTTYFPKRIRDDYDQFFETEVPPKALEPVLRRAGEAGVAVHVGFCEKADGHYFNTALLTDERGALAGTYRKIHLPGRPSPDGFAQVYEVRYFETGNTGYRVFPLAKARVGIAICQDRRYPESYRCLGLGGAEIVLIGYNTPLSPMALDQNELVLRAGAYENSLFVVGIAKAGVEDGLELIGGSCIVGPLGNVLARAATTGDELIAARIDLDWMTPARKRWDFFSRRHPKYYGAITEEVKPS